MVKKTKGAEAGERERRREIAKCDGQIKIAWEWLGRELEKLEATDCVLWPNSPLGRVP